MNGEDGNIHVHVDNFSDFTVQRTEEVEPEHFVCRTYVLVLPEQLQIASDNPQHYLDVLELDPLRKDAAITSLDNVIVICHSKAQAQSVRNQDAGLPEPDGIVLSAGQTLSVSGTGALWAVATVTGNSRVGVISNRRGRL